MGNACSSTQATAASSPEKAHEAASAKSKSAQQQQLSPQQSQPQQNVAASPGKPKEGSVQFVEAAKEQNHSALETAAEYLEVEKAAAAGSKVSKSFTKRANTWVIGQTVDIRILYEFGRVLGKGQFGTTRLATDRKTGQQVACKSISKRKLVSAEDIEDVRREVQILHHLTGHPNVVQIIGVYEDTQYVHICMEVASGGELFDRIVERGHYSEKDAAAAFRVMVGVIAHCHNMGVMHRDIKPENFLLASTAPDAPLKATDFGLSIFFKEGERFREIVGSAYYVAPEVLKRSYTKEADIWSLGVMLYILLSGVPPFYGETEAQIFQEVLTGELDLRSEPWPQVSEEAKELVRRLLVRDPNRRLTAQEVLNHPWVREDGVASDQPIKHEVLNRLQGFAAMHKLKKEALKIIAGFLPENEIKGLRELFHSIDADGSGTITVNELKEALKAKGQQIPEADIQNLVSGTDVNGNGTIDYEEFLAATIHQSKLEKEEHLYKAFQVLDKDGSGYIDRDELVAALDKYGDLSDLDTILKQVDKNDDGQIDYEEFVAMMRANDELHAAAGKISAGVATPGTRAALKDRNDIILMDGDKVQVLH